MAEKEIDTYYIGLRDPKELRRTILESSKIIIQNLQRHERFKELRNEKLRTAALLKQVVKDISSLVLRLKAELPAVKVQTPKAVLKDAVHANLPKRHHESRLKKKKEDVTQPIQREKTEIEKLEDELNFIEGKLNELG